VARARGFSFLEILVVLVLITLLSALALAQLGAGSGTRVLNQQAQRLQRVLSVMCEQAALEAKLYGLRLSKNSYAVQSPETPLPPSDGSAWVWVNEKAPAFAEHELPNGLTLALFDESDAIELPAQTSTTAAAPQIVCLEQNAWPVFQIAIRSANAEASDANSPARWITPDPSGGLQISESPR
jgi:general secretion pathway protein H